VRRGAISTIRKAPHSAEARRLLRPSLFQAACRGDVDTIRRLANRAGAAVPLDETGCVFAAGPDGLPSRAVRACDGAPSTCWGCQGIGASGRQRYGGE